jgi:hypothetical protein
MYYMPDVPSDTTYYNLNNCFNIKWSILDASTYIKPLSSVKCSEVVIHNTTGGNVTIKAGNSVSIDPASITEFVITNGTYFTVQGITNSDQLSCAGALSGSLYGRAQYYSSTPQTRQ